MPGGLLPVIQAVRAGRANGHARDEVLRLSGDGCLLPLVRAAFPRALYLVRGLRVACGSILYPRALQGRGERRTQNHGQAQHAQAGRCGNPGADARAPPPDCQLRRAVSLCHQIWLKIAQLF